MLTNINTDGDLYDLAEGVGVLRRFALRYQALINSCALCGMPCAGVMCLSCATK